MREKYPTDRVHQRVPPPTGDQLQEIFAKAKPGDSLKKILNPHLGIVVYGLSLAFDEKL